MKKAHSITLSGPVAIYRNRAINHDDFLHHVQQLATQLPAKSYALNLCENRYHFLVAFMACQQRQQTCLLPGSRADKEIQRLTNIYQDSYSITDAQVEVICQQRADNDNSPGKQQLTIQPEQQVAIVFTSGSTGLPTANPKTWNQLLASAEGVQQRLGLGKGQYVVASVPAQHMFGFEMSIVYPLLCGMCIYDGQPFYPLDIHEALAAVPAPRVLVTTPLHLGACNKFAGDWPEIDCVISATSPMNLVLASDSEEQLHTTVYDLYGCSEVGAIATRRLAQSENWQLLENYQLDIKAGKSYLQAPGYAQAIELPDQLEQVDASSFKLLGRNSDLVKLAGKRGSLADITHKLKKITGVDDAIVFCPDEQEGKRTRLAALVIAPGLTIETLRGELANHVDQVFIPRPFIKVSSLPYNDSGKLPRKELLDILASHKSKSLYQESA